MKNSASIVLCAVLAAPAAWAAPVTVHFGGTITSATAFSAHSVLASEIHVGDSFTGEFTYDTSTIASSQSATFAQYAGGDFSVHIGGFAETTHVSQISVTNGATLDSFYVAVPQAAGGLPKVTPPVFANWLDTSGQALGSTALPAGDAWPLPGFAASSFGGTQSEAGGDFLFFGTLAYATTAAAVPEPEGVSLMAVGLAGLAAALARRRRSARCVA